MKKLFDNAVLALWRGLAFCPIALLLGGALPGGSQLSAGLYYALGQALALGVSFVPSRRRVLVMLALGAAYAAAGTFGLGALNSPLLFILVAVCLGAYALTARAMGSIAPYDSRLMIAGAIIHAIAPVVIQLLGSDMDYSAFRWTGIAYLLMCPYIMNNDSVRDGMSLRGRGGHPIRRISRSNRVLVTGMVIVAVLIACAEQIRAAAQRTGEFVMYWVGQIIMWITELFAGSETSGGGNGGGMGGDMGLGLESAEPSWFALFMEKVMKYFVVVVLAAIAVFVLWKLGKFAVKMSKRVSEWAKRFAQGVREDYMEEREQLMDWGEVRGEMLEAIKDKLRRLTEREPNWGELDARGKVRYVMRQMYRKRGMGVSGLEFLSARQALSEMSLEDKTREELGELYDRARYSEHEVTEAQGEDSRRFMKLS